MKFSFTPSETARQLFQLKADEYRGEDWNALIDKTLGRKRANLYVFPQDPLRGRPLEPGLSFKLMMDLNGPDRLRQQIRNLPLSPCRFSELGTITCQ